MVSGHSFAETTAELLLSDRLLSTAESLAVGGPQQHAIARVLLEQAVALNPDDPELVATALRLASMTGAEQETVERLTRRLVLLNPAHHRAHADALTFDALTEQTVYERVAKARAMLDPDRRSSIPKPVQAEFAARAANWAYEANDTESLAWLLRVATQADPANGLAARLQHAYLAGLDNTPLEAIHAASVAWLAASPSDPEARLVVAEALLSEGAYQAASEQYRGFAQLLADAGAALPPATLRGWAASLIGAGKPADAVALIEGQITAWMSQPLAQEAAPATTNDAEKRTQALRQVPLEWLLLRQIALSKTVADEAQEEAFAEWMAAVDFHADHAGDAAAALALDQAWAAAILAPDVQDARPLVDAIEGDQPKAVRARGWLAARLGDAPMAGALFKEIGQTDRYALVGLATLQPPPNQVAFLKAIAQQAPGSLESMLAVHRLYGLKGRPAVTERGTKLLEQYQKLPTRLRQMELRGGPWVRARLAIAPETLTATGPLEAVLTLRNDLTAPLRLGPGGAGPDWLLIEPEAVSNGRAVPGLPPMQVPLDRILSIPARHALSLPVRLDRHVLGDVLIGNPWSDWRVVATAFSDPRPSVDPQGMTPPKTVAGPYGTMSVVRFSLRPDPPADDATVSSLMDRLGTGTQAAAWPKLLPLAWINAPSLGSRKNELIQTLTEGFAQASAVEQAWLLWLLPGQDPEGVDLASVREQAQRSAAPLVQIVFLLRHADTTDASVINAAKRHPDANVIAVATALAQLETLRDELEP